MGFNAKIYRIFILNELTTFVLNHSIEKKMTIQVSIERNFPTDMV